MVLLIFVLLLAWPLIELFLLIKAGAAVGALPVIFYCIATAVAGAAMLRIQGLSALNKARSSIVQGQVPVEAAVDGVFLAVAAPLLMMPGFISDILGFLLLIPPLRHAAARAALKRLRGKMERGEGRFYIGRF